MPFLSEIATWFKDYDLAIKFIASIAAPGGLWFLIDKFKNRIRIKIRRLGPQLGDISLLEIRFEAENVSSTLTSFEPEFTLVGHSPERKKQIYIFKFDGADRQLPSHVSKQFLGRHDQVESSNLMFLWFMTFRFPLSRGRHAKVRIRNANFEPVSFMRFHWERLLFLRFGKVPE